MKIVTEEAPPVTTRRKSVPQHVADALATALEKLPADRFETAKMFADALRNPAFAGTTVRADSSRSAPHSWRAQAAVPLAAAAALLLVLAAWGWMRPSASGSGAQNPLWLALEPPQGRFSDYPGPTLSPDGTRVAFFAPNAEGVVQLWVRDLSSTAAQPVLGTDVVEVDVAQQPFWSADGKSVAFFTQQALYRTELDGRAPIRLADAPNPRGGSWGSDGIILFVPATGGLHQLSANGGPATPVSNIDAPAGTIDRWPHFLPDGRHFLFLRRTPGAAPAVFVGSLDEPAVRPVLTLSSRAEYANGNLYFVRDGTLFAQPFDLKALTLGGTPTRVADGVGVGGADFRNVAFSAAAGHVVTWDGVWARLTQPTVIGADGRVRRTIGQPGAYLGFALERGGSRIAIERGDLRTSIPSIWVADVATGQFTVFATPPEGAGTPQWLPGARELIYSTFTGNTIVRQSLTSTDTASIGVPTAWISDVTPDGKSALISTTGEGTGLDIVLVPLDGSAAPRPYLNSPTSESGAVVSPDGAWIAYNSNASGVMEVYVQSFPIPGNRQLVSDGGGEHPQWSADGRMLYYLRANGELVAATVTRTGSALAFSRRPLFRVPTAELQTGVRKPFVPLGDGTFLFNLKHDAEVPNTMRIGLNWAGR
jgi:Tol biopolymer transport system component